MEFGGLVSTSNALLPAQEDSRRIVTVTTPKALVWTVEYDSSWVLAP